MPQVSLSHDDIERIFAAYGVANTDDAIKRRTFTASYIEAALFCGIEPPEGDPRKDHDTISLPEACVAMLAPETLAKLILNAKTFWHTQYAALQTFGIFKGRYDYLEAAGHDFWYSQNGHGSGFWDGDWVEPYATQFDEAAKSFRELDLYFGDDGKVYC